MKKNMIGNPGRTKYNNKLRPASHWEVVDDVTGVTKMQIKAEKGSFVSDLSTLLESGAGADVTLVTGKSEQRAHSQILAARSPVFAAMFKHNMQETHSRRVEVPDVQEAVLKQLLCFTYCDTAPQLESMAAELFVAADKYDLPLLKKRCEDTMKHNISVNNAATYASLAVLHSCPQLKSAAVAFIRTHNQVMGTDGWAQLLRNNAEVAVEICKEVATPSQNNRMEPYYIRTNPYYMD